MKKILTTFSLLLLIGFYIFPSLAFAQTSGSTTKEPPATCWTQTLCSQKNGGWQQTASSKTLCGAYETEAGSQLGYCIAQPPTVNLQVTIGSNQAKGLTGYIPQVYNYMVSIVSIVAIVMIMVGGLEYLTAGGNSSKIESAKERILGAIIGLFLVLGSYTLLNTINPALTQLKLPPIKMVRQQELTKGTVCGDDTPQKTGNVVLSNCSNDCGCYSDQTCEEVAGSAGQIIDFSKVVVWGATSVAGGAVAGGAQVASAGRYVIKGSLSTLQTIAKSLAKFVVKKPLETATGATAYMVVSSLGGDSGTANQSTKSVKNGICVKLANKSIPAGGLCAFSSNCVSEKCIDITTKKELTGSTLGEIGTCVGDPKVFEGKLACTSNQTCFANAGTGSGGKIECVGGFCSWGAENETCCETGKNPANTGGSYKCTTEWACTQTGTTCAFQYNNTWYATGADYSSVGCQANQAWCQAYLNTYAGSKGTCVKDNLISNP